MRQTLPTPSSLSMDSTHLSFGAAGEHDDPLKRLTRLRLFFSSGTLTREECRYIKILLSNINVDLIGDLPLEIVKQIALLLELHEFMLCLTISRRWRSKLLSPAILHAVTDRFCPSLTHSINKYDSEIYLDALYKRRRARWGYSQSSLSKEFCWEHESYFKLDPVYYGSNHNVSTVYAQFGRHGNDPEIYDQSYSSALYSHGKIAWRAKPHVVVVDNLWNRTRKIFGISAGALVRSQLQILALGDRLVVGAMNRSIVAWDHVTNDFIAKKLPGPVRYATSKGLQVGIVLYHGDAFLWKFGGIISTFATAPLQQLHGIQGQSLKTWISNLRIFFHPTCSRTLFLASGYTYPQPGSGHSDAVLKRMVYEFKDMKHIRSFKLEIPIKVAKYENPTDIRVDIQKVLPYRRDIIGFYQQIYRPLPQSVMPYQYDNFVEFDIYDRRFISQTGEKFNFDEFGWRYPLEDGDLDFQVTFYSNGFSVTSHQPGFDFRIGD
ncbi:hypothetical protein F4811DRAFT_534477 [Daldinia bambusicola]|nr:hypothetical protein F4811DRAFT_534477 [Daldinia bambusicola]